MRQVATLCLVGLLIASASAAFTPQYSKTFGGKTLTFALIGDWGRIGGVGSDGTLANCEAQAKAYIACLNGNNSASCSDDPMGDACGGLQQLKTAALMNTACGMMGCQFVVNTADNFYATGCYAENANVSAHDKCSGRFKSDWENVYNTKAMNHINKLPWLNSLGNHDVTAYTAGVDAQIAYQKKNPNWILPSRWYAADVKAASGPSVRFHVAHTSCFVANYAKPGSSYYVDEVIKCSSPADQKAQIDFLTRSMASSTADYNVVIGHHPAVSSAGPSYFQTDSKIPTYGWTGLAKLMMKYNPVAYFNGHDHTEAFMYAPVPVVSMDANITYAFPKTGFYTSGAGGWAQAGDGGYGLPEPYSFVRYQNTDLMRGIAPGGFAIVKVDAGKFSVMYYSADTLLSVPFRVDTPKGGRPRSTKNPLATSHDVLVNTDGSSNVFRKLLSESQ